MERPDANWLAIFVSGLAVFLSLFLVLALI